VEPREGEAERLREVCPREEEDLDADLERDGDREDDLDEPWLEVRLFPLRFPLPLPFRFDEVDRVLEEDDRSRVDLSRSRRSPAGNAESLRPWDLRLSATLASCCFLAIIR
jgi:hypothetical protein